MADQEAEPGKEPWPGAKGRPATAAQDGFGVRLTGRSGQPLRSMVSCHGTMGHDSRQSRETNTEAWLSITFSFCLVDAFLPPLSRWVPLGRNRYDPEELLFGRGL
jgi:hypothetical protein